MEWWCQCAILKMRFLLQLYLTKSQYVLYNDQLKYKSSVHFSQMLGVACFYYLAN